MSGVMKAGQEHPWGPLALALEAACQGPADLVPFHASQALARHLADRSRLPLAEWPASPAG